MIILVRHAEAAWVDATRGAIVRDPSLTVRGVKQLPHLCRFLGALEINTFIYSPQRRVEQTLEYLRPTLRCKPRAEPWLREIRYPDWEGATPGRVFGELDAMDAADVATRWRGLRGGESLRSYTRYVRRGALAFLRECGMERASSNGLWSVTQPQLGIGVLGHAGSLAVLGGLLLGLPSVAWERQRLPFRQASTSRLMPIRVGDSFAFSLVDLGRDDFIPERLRSSS